MELYIKKDRLVSEITLILCLRVFPTQLFSTKINAAMHAPCSSAHHHLATNQPEQANSKFFYYYFFLHFFAKFNLSNS